ncbi:MAG: hypothetical protein JWP32_926 [Schumannella sp.]|nr:hypothetical protein [Schumannella sp.]
MKKILAIVAAAVFGTALLTAGGPVPPQSLLNIPCSKLSAAVSPSTFFSTTIAERDAAAQTIRETHELPEDDAIRQVGGLTCEWSNGLPTTGKGGWLGVRLELLPAAETSFRAWADTWGFTGTAVLGCDGSLLPWVCTYDGLVDGDWLSMRAVGVAGSTAGRELLRGLRDAVQLAGPSGAPVWSPPAGSVRLPRTCDAIVPGSFVDTAFSPRFPVETYVDFFGSSVPSGARSRVGAVVCAWLVDGADIASMITLPGGAWAWPEARPLLTRPGALRPLSIPSLRPGDEAYLRCDASRQDCFVDLIVGGNWISLHAGPDFVGRMYRADRGDALTAIARQIVGLMYS